VAHPAGKIFAVFLRMNTFHKFIPDSLKIKPGEFIVAFVAIHTRKTGLKAQVVRMRKLIPVFCGMAIGAHEGTVVRQVEFRGIDDIERIHSFLHIPPVIFIEIGKVFISVANKAFVIFFNGDRCNFRFFLCRSPMAGNADEQEEQVFIVFKHL